MIRINENFQKLQASYLFANIAKRVNAYQQANPDKSIIRLGIGDVTRALPSACIDALHKAVYAISLFGKGCAERVFECLIACGQGDIDIWKHRSVKIGKNYEFD